LKKAEYFVEAVRIHLVPVKNEKKAWAHHQISEIEK
jgi:hypothetical protein